VRNARALGGEAARWLDDLPNLLAELRCEWGFTLGRPLSGGNSAFVAEVTTAQGEPAVLKAAIAGYEPLAGEARTLELAGGRGYARLLRSDLRRGVLLIERLGAPVSSRGLSVDRQIEVLCEALRQAWRPLEDPGGLQTGVDKADWHEAFLQESWEALGRPCPEWLVAHAITLCGRRRAAYAPQGSLLLHGDPHEENALADPLRPGAWRFVDPDGLFAEPAYDLAVLMRGWTEEILAGDPVEAGRARCRRLAELAAQPAAAIWEWGIIERVSTGLLLIKLEAQARGSAMLQVAQAWAAADA
jgi:streptomycin 6-kinase